MLRGPQGEAELHLCQDLADCLRSKWRKKRPCRYPARVGGEAGNEAGERLGKEAIVEVEKNTT